MVAADKGPAKITTDKKGKIMVVLLLVDAFDSDGSDDGVYGKSMY